MQPPLLATKLHAPPARRNWIARDRLRVLLDRYADFRLTSLAAPAGFGKTALVSTWIAPLDVPWTWLTLDANDNDLIRFVTYLLAAVQRIDPGIGSTVQTVLQSPQSLSPDALATLLINDVWQAEIGPCLIVLDDYHHITYPAIHDFMAFWLEHKPPDCHIMLLSRQDSPLPLARWRARGEMNEIRERDLQFSPEETGVFLHETMGLSLPAAMIETLTTRTEGWIVGLQLAALSLRGHPDQAEFIANFSGSNRYVIDYLAEEVLHQQAPGVRAFLRQTSILDHLCAPLCDAVTGRTDSQDLLIELEQANLFLIPLDDQRVWYRYHPLFAEFLRFTLEVNEEVDLHQRASIWFETQIMPEAAIVHALAVGELSGDLHAAARLISRTGENLLHTGQVVTVHSWLAALPDDMLQADRQLSILNAWRLLLNGDVEGANLYLALAADETELPLTQHEQGLLMVIRSVIAIAQQDYAAAIAASAQAVARLPGDENRWRLLALWSSIEARERTRPITEAIDELRAARAVGYTVENHIFAAIIESFLAAALNHHTQREAAIAVCGQALMRYTDDQGRVSPIACHVVTQLGYLHYEANELDRAYDTLKLGVRLSEQLGFGAVISFAKGTLARVLYAQGDTDAALTVIDSAQQHETKMALGDSDWSATVAAGLQLALGNLPFVQQWLAAAQISPADDPAYLRFEAQIILARMLLADDQPQRAADWLVRLFEFTQERELLRWQITVRILQALAADQLGDSEAVVDYLAQAVAAAEAGGYLRAFLDEDQRVLDLLPHVQHVAPAFVDQLVSGVINQVGAGATGRRLDALIDPLSERELEVLVFIADGLSNQEIAQELVIAVGTVKRHVHNILEKLGVSSRLQATIKARAIGLLTIQP